MQKLLDIPAGQVLASGIFPSLIGSAPALWVDGRNVFFEDGGVRNSNGQILLDDGFPLRPTGITTALALAERRAYVGAGTKVYSYTTGAGLVEIGACTASGGIWTFAAAGTVLLLSNGVDQVEYWPNTGSSAPITPPTSVTRAQLLAKFGDYFLMADTNLDNNVVYNSAFADPTNWTTGTSGNKQIRNIKGGIKQFVPLGPYQAIYGPNDLFEMHLTGDTSRFALNPLLSGVGALSPYSVVEVNGQHYGLMLEDAFTTTGSSSESIASPAMRKKLRAEFDTSKAQNVFGYYDQNNKMVCWFVPTASSRIHIGYSLESGTWTQFDNDYSIAAGADVWDSTLYCNLDSIWRDSRATYDVDDDPITSYLQTKPLAFSMTDRYKQLEALEFDGEWEGEVLVDIGIQDKPTSAISWAYTDLPIDDVVTFEPREALYFSFRIHSEEVDAQWEIKGIRAYGEPTGYWS